MTPEEHGRWNGTDSPMQETKFCRRCERQLPLDAFGRVRADRPWLRSKCKECEAERRRDSRKEARRGDA